MSRYYGGYDYSWRPYVSVAERKAKALKYAQKLEKKEGRKLTPVHIEGRKIAKTWWGMSWCDNLEHYSDYSNRLPRGATYVRNGSVIDLQISEGKISALVSGSEIYTVTINIKPLEESRWEKVVEACSQRIDSVVELLQGKFSDGVMKVLTDSKTGIFPAPSEIKFSCSCPDWAGVCKHVAAVMYGIGARLDEQPELFFRLRGVDETELAAKAAVGDTLLKKGARKDRKVLSKDETELSSIFGIEMVPDEQVKPKASKAKTAQKKTKTPTKVSLKKTVSVSKTEDSSKAPIKALTKKDVSVSKAKAKVQVKAGTIKSSAGTKPKTATKRLPKKAVSSSKASKKSLPKKAAAKKTVKKA